MTSGSRKSPGGNLTEIERLAEDLRRQREDLQRQKAQADVDSETTAVLLKKIDELRRRTEAVRPREAVRRRGR